MKMSIIALLVLVSFNAFALSDNQKEAIALASEIGQKYGVPELKGMVMAESSGCVFKKGDGGRSLGCVQVGVRAARDVFKWCASGKCTLRFKGTDESLKHRLAHDNRFNLTVGALYMRLLLAKFENRKRALVAYNAGMKTARIIEKPRYHPYVMKVSMYY